MKAQRMRPGDPRRFFSTAQFYRLHAASGGELVSEPTSPVHAKEMGTRLTVCGLPADNWFKYCDLPFDNDPSDRCPECVSVLAGLRRNHSSQ